MNLFLVLGFIGAAILTLSYTALTLGYIEGKSKTYPFLNMVGSIMIMTSSIYLDSKESIAYSLMCLPLSFFAAIGKFPSIKLALYPIYKIGLLLSIPLSVFLNLQSATLELIFSVMGFVGVYMLISAYIMVLSKQIEDYSYIKINMIAGFIFLPILLFDNNYPKLWDETFGLALEFYALYRIRKTLQMTAC